MHGFPAALASFIGRAGAVRDVAGLVEECRLVTVTGPGGVGKTRLARQVAGQVAGRFTDGAAAALAGYALRVAGQAAAGLWTITGEAPAACWLDAEDATMRQGLAWAMEHDTTVALQLANALAWWWFLRGRLAGQYRLLCQAAGRAEAGSDGWCTVQLWLGRAAQYSADLAASLGHFTAVRDAVAGRLRPRR